MKENTDLTRKLKQKMNKDPYASCVKEILASREIRAWILKFCTKEFCSYSIEDIMEKCLAPKVEIPEKTIRQKQANLSEEITGAEQESAFINDNGVSYDVCFQAVQQGEKQPVMVIVNLESRAKNQISYEFVTRGIYHCARLLSEQKEEAYTNVQCREFKKLYSICICLPAASGGQAGMSKYHMTGENVCDRDGSRKEQDNFNLAEVVVLKLAESGDEHLCELLDLLNLIFSQIMSPTEKIMFLEQKYGIEMTPELENAVRHMYDGDIVA